MKWSDFETRLKPEMVPAGKRYNLTIKEVVIEKVYPKPNQAEQGIVLHFKETDKSLVLNANNRRRLWQMFGDDVAGCAGKRIALYTEQRSKTNLALVIRIDQAQEASQTTAAIAKTEPATADAGEENESY